MRVYQIFHTVGDGSEEQYGFLDHENFLEDITVTVETSIPIDLLNLNPSELILVIPKAKFIIFLLNLFSLFSSKVILVVKRECCS